MLRQHVERAVPLGLDVERVLGDRLSGRPGTSNISNRLAGTNSARLGSSRR